MAAVAVLVAFALGNQCSNGQPPLEDQVVRGRGLDPKDSFTDTTVVRMSEDPDEFEKYIFENMRREGADYGVELLQNLPADEYQEIVEVTWTHAVSGQRQTYVGQIKAGDLPHGVGIGILTDGYLLEGRFENYLQQGHVKMTHPDKIGIFTGEVKDGVKHGHGTTVLSSGNKYTGEHKNGKRHGHGEYTFKIGHTYIGDWIQDAMHGTGTLYRVDGTELGGQWRDNHQDGDGYRTSPPARRQGEEDPKTVNTYKGQYKEGKQHGYGTFTWTPTSYYPKGATYVGMWKDNQRSGYGTYTSGDGTGKEGEWAGDKLHGNGSMTYHMVDDFRTPPRLDNYTGMFVNGEHHGHGTYLWATGIKYVGAWQYGNMHGHGLRTYDDDVSYEGNFVNDDRHGPGMITHGSGTTFKGVFYEDDMHGAGVLTVDGVQYDVVYEHDIVKKATPQLQSKTVPGMQADEAIESGADAATAAGKGVCSGLDGGECDSQELLRFLLNAMPKKSLQKKAAKQNRDKQDISFEQLSIGEYLEVLLEDGADYGVGLLRSLSTLEYLELHKYVDDEEGDSKGDIYVGQQNENADKEGVGIYIFADGTRYEGHWRMNMRNGAGRERQPDGSILKGLYEDDDLIVEAESDPTFTGDVISVLLVVSFAALSWKKSRESMCSLWFESGKRKEHGTKGDAKKAEKAKERKEAALLAKKKKLAKAKAAADYKTFLEAKRESRAR